MFAQRMRQDQYTRSCSPGRPHDNARVSKQSGGPVLHHEAWVCPPRSEGLALSPMNIACFGGLFVHVLNVGRPQGVMGWLFSKMGWGAFGVSYRVVSLG